MATTVDPNAVWSGAPVSVTYGGVEMGATTSNPKITLDVEAGAPAFTNAGGPVKGTRGIRKIIPSIEITLNEIDAQRFAWALPGATATSSQSVGVLVAGLATTLGADPILGATTIWLASVATVNVGNFIRIGDTLTEALSEVVRVVTKGAGGSADTVIENSAGGGLLIDHGNGEAVVTCLGTIMAAPSVAGATNIKVDAVTGLSLLAPGDYVRIGYVGHYETRLLTAVGSIGPSGTGITFATPLTRDHGLDEWVVRVAAIGGTTIRPVIGRLGDATYQSLVLTDVGADGRTMIVTLDNAASAETQALEFSDDPANPLGLALKLTGHYGAATPTTVPISFVISA
jgi:hypothetical protein